jgi:hypothetical protein
MSLKVKEGEVRRAEREINGKGKGEINKERRKRLVGRNGEGWLGNR